VSTTLEPTSAALAALRAAIDGQLYTPDDEGYDTARRAWNLVVDQHPAAVVLPTSARDVAETVRAAAAAGLRVTVQTTGHNVGTTGDLRDTVLVRTSAMHGVRIDPDRRVAHVEAGALWEQVVEPAAAHGLVALHGSSPDVGVVGYCLGGGIGWLARRHGLAAHHVVAAEVVTADGRIVRVTAEDEPDLLWALKGGGGNVAVVTALEIRLFPLDQVTAGWLIWPWEDSHRVLSAWTAWCEDAPESVTSIARLLQLPPLPVIPEPLRGRRLVVIELAVLHDGPDPEAVIAPLRALAPEIDTVQVMPPIGLMRLHQDPEGPTPGLSDSVMLDGLPEEALRELLAAAGPGSDSPLLAVELRQLGGALARPVPGAALSELDGRFVLFALGLPMDPDQGAAIMAAASGLVARMAPWGRGRRYMNFTEVPVDAGEFFAEGAHRRLRAVRDAHDPERRLQANHAVG